jgi:hypothetical protein
MQLLLSLNLGIRWGEWSVSRSGRALSPVPIVQETGWASEGEEIYLLLSLNLVTRWGEWSVLRSGRALSPVPIVQ